MSGAQPREPTILRPAFPMQFENQASNPPATLEFPTSSSMPDGTPHTLEPKPPGPKKARKKSAKSQNARAGSAGPSVPVDVDGEPAYRLSRVQKIVKMNDQAQISREAVFVMALAAEDITRRLTRAGCDAAKEAHRQEMTLSDVATAVQASTSLSFLSEVIPQTIPLSTARSRRLTKDITPFPPDSTQTMVSRVQDQLRHTSRPAPFTTHKMGTTGGMGAPVAVLMPPGNAPVRNYSPREARAVANAKPGQGSSNGRSLPAPMAVGPMGAMMPPHAIPLPPGFDHRTLGAAGMPPPLPGMTFHHVDPEAYRNGIRWAPVQAGGEISGTAQEGSMPLPPGMWTDGQFLMPGPPPAPGQLSPHMHQGLPTPPAPVTPPQPAPSNSRSTRRASSTASKAAATAQRKQNQNQAASIASSKPSPTSTSTSTAAPAPARSDRDGPSQGNSETTPDSPFRPGQLHGRTIYNTGGSDAGTGASSAEQPRANVNGRGPTAAPAKKGKRASTKGRGSAVKKNWEGEEDAMDLNP